MSKNISVKINNGNKTIETVKLNSANQKVIIKAQPHVNYELVDEATQYAPEMIDTKRVGNDLHIAFEGTDINKESDLVLEGYYEHDNTELVLGMAEDGQYYAYVPQSGVESDAVTLLADQVFAPQALGGNSVTAPFWAFNPNWLWVAAGVAAVGGIIAAASSSHGGGSSNNTADKPSDNSDKNNGAVLDNANNNGNTAKDTTAPAKPIVEAKDNGSVDVTPPTDADTQSVEVNYTDEADTPKTATLTKGNDGNWTSNNPDVAVDPATGKATIPADKVQDGSPVKAKATDTSGNTGEEGTANAGNNPDTTAPAKPTVEAKDNGSVSVTPPADPDTQSVEVNYTNEAGNPKTATLTKGEDGNWTSNNPDVAVNPATGKATIPADKVQDGSPVKAKATDTSGNTGEEGSANAGNNPDTTAPAKPTVEAKDNGSVSVTPPADPDTQSVEVNYTDEAGTPKTATLTKGNDGNWTSNNPDVAVDPATGKATIPADKVKDGSPVTAKATDTAGNAGEEGSANAGNNPDTTAPAKPTVEAKDNGSVDVTPPADADTQSIEVNYTDEAGTSKTATLNKGNDGNWTSNNPDVAVNPATGKATIPADKVQDGSPVKAKATDTSGNTGEEGSANAGNNPDTTAPAKPTVEAKDNGSVEVTPPADADTKSVEVSYTDEAGTPKTATLTKGDNGNWTSNNPDVAVDPATGKATIPADKVKDGSPVTAKATDTAGNAGEEGTANAGNNPDTTAPSAPKMDGLEDSSVLVTMPKEAEVGDSVVIRGFLYKDGDNLDIVQDDIDASKTLATLTKQQDGSWISDKPENVPNVNAGDTNTIIPANTLKGFEHVYGYGIDPAGNQSPWGGIHLHRKMDSPNVTVKTDGFVEITYPTAQDLKSMKVRYTDKAGTQKITMLTKGEDGNWTSDNPDVTVDPATGKTIISADKIQPGSLVWAKVFTNSGIFSDEVGLVVGKIDMGSGDDILKTSGPIHDSVYKGISIDGGDDFDTLEFVNRDGKAIKFSISAFSNFEKIDIKGTLNNTLNIQKDDVERNHNAKPTVDDSGKSHNNVLIIDGDKGDKVNLNDISEVASSQVNYKGNTYHVYNTGSNELWVDSDITVA